MHVHNGRRLRIKLHAGQRAAHASRARFVVVVAGTQGGKTIYGPVWLFREIERRGPGDYMVVTPTFSLSEVKALPAFRSLFENSLQLGKYVGSPIRKFVFSDSGIRRLWPGLRTRGVPRKKLDTVVYFGHAMDPDSLESATAKAAWLDECGQRKFKASSWDAIQRRLAINQGRALFTTTPYNLGWFKQLVVDRCQGGPSPDPDYHLIKFPSTENPAFSQAEMDRARRTMPDWKFRMFYLAEFERPVGLIYDSFDEQRCKIPRIAVPPDWPRFLGLDFGAVNLVGLFYARDPATDYLYLYRTYRSGGKTAAQHTAALLAGEPADITAVGGSKSESQWRNEFRAAGLPVREPPITDVELGISRVYGAHKQNRIYVFDDQTGYLVEKESYARALDDIGQPTEKIEDRASFHHMDAERYIVSYLEDPRAGMGVSEVIEYDPLDEVDW